MIFLLDDFTICEVGSLHQITGRDEMTKRFEVGQVVFTNGATGGQYIRVATIRENGELTAHVWVKTKKNWTKKTSLFGYGPTGTERFQILTADEAARFGA